MPHCAFWHHRLCPVLSVFSWHLSFVAFTSTSTKGSQAHHGKSQVATFFSRFFSAFFPCQTHGRGFFLPFPLAHAYPLAVDYGVGASDV